MPDSEESNMNNLDKAQLIINCLEEKSLQKISHIGIVYGYDFNGTFRKIVPTKNFKEDK
jgi:hypothetical protein